MDMRSLIAVAKVSARFQELCESAALSPAVSQAAFFASYVLGARFIRKVVISSMSPLKRRRYVGRQFISRARHPTRSKFKGAARCFRQRFNTRAVW